MTGAVPNPTFELPEMVSILFQFREGHVIAHNLDFDLATSGETVEEATALIKDCTKAHVEYALESGLEDRLCRSAPKGCWRLAAKAKAMGTSEVICIDARRGPERAGPVAIGIMARALGHLPVAAQAG